MALTGQAKTDYQREYMRRRRAAGKPAQPKPAAVKPSGGSLTRSSREGRSRSETFTEAGKLRAEIGRLKSDIVKLKAALQEEPDAAKLRKKVIEQRMEMASLRQALRRVAKERDKWMQRKYRDALRHCTRETYALIVKALHPDRSQHVTATELAAAQRVAIGLRPLFIEDQD